MRLSHPAGEETLERVGCLPPVAPSAGLRESPLLLDVADEAEDRARGAVLALEALAVMMLLIGIGMLVVGALMLRGGR